MIILKQQRGHQDGIAQNAPEQEARCQAEENHWRAIRLRLHHQILSPDWPSDQQQRQTDH